ncbi:MAG TPA: UDP binding domain-containing protein [Devosia sp.]|nr:UDP binding domain-containing protein [Devosia sp.]
MRDAPSIALIRTLQDAGVYVRAFDPESMKTAKGIIESITYAGDVYDAAKGADALCW